MRGIYREYELNDENIEKYMKAIKQHSQNYISIRFCMKTHKIEVIKMKPED